jgi:hypothetical protein
MNDIQEEIKKRNDVDAVTGKLAAVNVQDFVWKITICLSARLALVSDHYRENLRNEK